MRYKISFWKFIGNVYFVIYTFSFDFQSKKDIKPLSLNIFLKFMNNFAINTSSKQKPFSKLKMVVCAA